MASKPEAAAPKLKSDNKTISRVAGSFAKKHDGQSPTDFVKKAEMDVYEDLCAASPASASREGRNWMNRAHVPSPTAGGLVTVYHDHEEAAKQARAAGDVAGAIKHIDAAYKAREAFARSRPGGNDAAHNDAMHFLMRRRASLSEIDKDLRDQVEIDPRVAAAKAEVHKHYANNRTVSPL